MAKYDLTHEPDETISTYNSYIPALSRVDDTHILVAYSDDGPDLEVGILTFAGDWTVTQEATLTIDGASSVLGYPLLVKIDSTHFMVIWQDSAGDGKAQIVTVNTGTWAVTAEGAPLEFDTSDYISGDACLIDTQNVMLAYKGVAADGFIVMLQVNLGTWAVTKPGAALEFATTDVQTDSLSCCKIDGTHIILFWADDGLNGVVRVFSVNTGTGTITAEDSELEFDGASGRENSCCMIDANHFINFWRGSGDDGFAQAFTVNLGTFAVTAEGAAHEYDAVQGNWNSCHQIDETHYLNVHMFAASDAGAVIGVVDLGTWAVTSINNTEIKDATSFAYSDLVAFDEFGNFLSTWRDNSTQGVIKVIHIEGIKPAVTGGFSGTMIKSWIFG